MTREELVDDGWLGPGPPPLHLRRLGDVALLPYAPVGFVDPAMPGERRLVGAHGSLTAAEMLVPLLAGRGRRRIVSASSIDVIPAASAEEADAPR